MSTPEPPKIGAINNVYNEPHQWQQFQPAYKPTDAEISDMDRAVGILENQNSSYDSVREAVAVMKRMAEKGEIEACEALGDWFAEGSHFLRKKPENYVYYMTLAAQNGSEYAMDRLAWSYLKGDDGIEADHYEAHKLYYTLHQLLPLEQEYTLYYALGLFNGYPWNPYSESERIQQFTLEVSDAVLSAEMCGTGLRATSVLMIKKLAADGYPQAQAIYREMKKWIAEEVAAKVAMKFIYSLI